jgi:hypothetical protein
VFLGREYAPAPRVGHQGAARADHQAGQPPEALERAVNQVHDHNGAGTGPVPEQRHVGAHDIPPWELPDRIVEAVAAAAQSQPQPSMIDNQKT